MRNWSPDVCWQLGGRFLQLCVCAAAEGVDEVKVKAVNEMMERIKHGVVLRPVKSQDSKVRVIRVQQSRTSQVSSCHPIQRLDLTQNTEGVL